MKKLITCCCLACFVIFLTGCILVSSEKKEFSKESHPAEASATTKTAGPYVRPPIREPARGNIVINISAGSEDNFRPYEWAEIHLNGAFIGSTHSMQLNLEAGQHKITVKAPGYKPFEKIITILPIRTDQRLNILLVKEHNSP